MKILIVYRHYWPDTPPLGSILPLPPDQGRGILRAVGAGLFMAQAFAYAARHRFDLVWTTTLPPVLNGVMGRAAARFSGARFLYHVMDIYPEAAIAGGMARAGLVSRLAARIDSATCRSADAVVVLSRDMAETIRRRGGNDRVHFHILNNPVLAELETVDRLDRAAAPGKRFRFIFSGNMGHFQSLPLLVEAMAHVPVESDIELVFLGDGPVKPALVARASELGLSHVRFFDRLPPLEAFEVTRGADVGVVSLAPGVYRTSYPSKVMTYLAAGLPILAIVEGQSALAEYLDAHEAGAAAPHEPEAIARAMLALRDLYADGVPRMRLSGRALADFGREQTARRWSELVDKLSFE